MTINGNLSLSEAFEGFIASRYAKGVCDKTIESYQNQFRSISHHFDIDRQIGKICQDDIDAMIVSMRRNGNLSGETIRTYTRCLRTFFNWLDGRGILMPKIKLYRATESYKAPYTDDELIRLLAPPAEDCSFCELRDWTIINFLVNSGCRAGTVRSIYIDDLHLDEKVVFFRHTKNGQIQMMPICNAMVTVFRRYLSVRRGTPSSILFPSARDGAPLTEDALRHAIVRFSHSRGVQKTSIHLFRHTFAKKFLLDCQGDAFTLQYLLGHKTLAMTRHYCNLYNADVVHRFEQLCPLNSLKKTDTGQGLLL